MQEIFMDFVAILSCNNRPQLIYTVTGKPQSSNLLQNLKATTDAHMVTAWQTTFH